MQESYIAPTAPSNNSPLLTSTTTPTRHEKTRGPVRVPRAVLPSHTRQPVLHPARPGIAAVDRNIALAAAALIAVSDLLHVAERVVREAHPVERTTTDRHQADASTRGVLDDVVLNNRPFRRTGVEQERRPTRVANRVRVDLHVATVVNARPPDGHHALVEQAVVADVRPVGAHDVNPFAEAFDEVVLDDAVAPGDFDAHRRLMRTAKHVLANDRTLAHVHDAQPEAAVIRIHPVAEAVAFHEHVAGVVPLQLDAHAPQAHTRV